MNKQLVENLQKLRALFSGPEKWTQKYMARDKDGAQCSVDIPEAACWCLFGGIYKLFPRQTENDFEARNAMCAYLDDMTGKLSFISWQDAPERTFEEVINFLDRAVEKAKADE